MRANQYIPALRHGAKIGPNEMLGLHTTGNVYYVVKENWGYYDEFVTDYDCTYSDGTTSVCGDVGTTTGTESVADLNLGIQDALDKCVSARDDHVIIIPSAADYDIGAVLTMTTHNVSLMGYGGKGLEVGTTQACRIHQIDADASLLSMTGDNIEVAGLYLKPATTYPAITLQDSCWGPRIHHNTIWWYGTTTYVVGPVDDYGDGGSYGSIEYNLFITAGSSATTTDVIKVENEAVCCRVNGNVCVVDNSNTCSRIIHNKSLMSETSNNRVGAGTGGSVTRAITVPYGIGTGNMVATGATADVAPATNTNGFVGNWSGATGGAAADQAA